MNIWIHFGCIQSVWNEFLPVLLAISCYLSLGPATCEVLDTIPTSPCDRQIVAAAQQLGFAEIRGQSQHSWGVFSGVEASLGQARAIRCDCQRRTAGAVLPGVCMSWSAASTVQSLDLHVYIATGCDMFNLKTHLRIESAAWNSGISVPT